MALAAWSRPLQCRHPEAGSLLGLQLLLLVLCFLFARAEEDCSQDAPQVAAKQQSKPEMVVDRSSSRTEGDWMFMQLGTRLRPGPINVEGPSLDELLSAQSRDQVAEHNFPTQPNLPSPALETILQDGLQGSFPQVFSSQQTVGQQLLEEQQQTIRGQRQLLGGQQQQLLGGMPQPSVAKQLQAQQSPMPQASVAMQLQAQQPPMASATLNQVQVSPETGSSLNQAALALQQAAEQVTNMQAKLLAERQATFSAEQRAAQDEQRLQADEQQLQSEQQKSEALKKHASEVEHQANALQQQVDILQAELQKVHHKETQTRAQRARLQDKLTHVLAQTRAVEDRIHLAEAAAHEWQRRVQASDAQKAAFEAQLGQVVQNAEQRAIASKAHGMQLATELHANTDHLRASKEALQNRDTTLSNAVLQIQRANSQVLSLWRQLNQQTKLAAEAQAAASEEAMRLNSSEARRLETEARLHAYEDIMQRAPALTGPLDFQDMANTPAISAPLTVDDSTMQFQQQTQPQGQFQEQPWQSPSQSQQFSLEQQPQLQLTPLLDASSGLEGSSPWTPGLPLPAPPLQASPQLLQAQVTPSSMQLIDGGGSNQHQGSTLKHLLGRVQSLIR